ncbi:glycosyltransferase family 4 protein [Pseudoroseomonas sp. WGS1072]|uniref:glycosyltransferase family 4 protein n=1 Tax=Roseomonas sp. WGS1072 TaxID=3366816 RepID=UPI003BF4431B
MPAPILLSAFACDPRTGSEPYVGWQWTLMLEHDFDLHVLTRSYSRKLIETEPPRENVRFHYFDLPFCSGFNHHWRFIKLYYCCWQLAVLPYVLTLHLRTRFAIMQHLTYNNLDVPGFLWLCPGTRFVWGPVGGGQVPPASLRAIYGRNWWKERLRALLKASARYNPLVRLALRRARHVFFANEETAQRVADLPRAWSIMLETAIDEGKSGLPLPASRPGRPVQILWLSHVFPRKGLALAIDAFTEACRKAGDSYDMKLVVVGDGPALPQARLQAERSAAKDHIALLGAVDHDVVQALMRSADVFLFTSVQDTSGNVILEAMINGVPVVALDHQGAKSITAHQGSILVPVGSYADTVSGIAAAINALAEDPHRRHVLGMAAKQRAVEQHTWRSKRKQVQTLYQALLK